jgi:formylglycine-generating enzyme required for sulfatase activity
MVDEKALEIRKTEDLIRYQPEAEKLIQRGLKELQQLPTILERSQPFEPEMILISAGEFLMGSDPSVDKDARDDEQPQHTLYLPDYYMARTPVTNAQYATFVQATGHEQPWLWKDGKPPRGKENHPMVKVSWYDAMAYCRWLAEVTGKSYCLPSEAEWEKGARGSDGRIYPWGNQWDAERCNSKEGGKGDTTPVGAYPQGASPYGLLDMAGNVLEWTRSLLFVYNGDPFNYPYNAWDGREAFKVKGPGRLYAYRAMRGGLFDNDEGDVRCACRRGGYPERRPYGCGFRVVVAPDYSLDVKKKEKPTNVRKPETIHPLRQTPPRGTVPEPEMVLIPAGEFLMGSDPSVDKDARDEEQPQHALYLPDYYLAKTSVTNAQYAAFVRATGYEQPEHWTDMKPPRGEENHPVVNVSWYDAVAYCRWLAEVTGKPYCLPSEAEWEKGVRGSDGRIHPWGNQWDAELDMVGDLSEWTRSVYRIYPYDPEDGRENLRGETRRVVRGASSGDDVRCLRCAHRRDDYPYHYWSNRGFRVVMASGSSLDCRGANHV